MGSAILLARGGERLRNDISRSTLVVSGSDLPLRGVTSGNPKLNQGGRRRRETGTWAVPFFFAAVVSPCRCEPQRAGCCGAEGVLRVS